MAAIAANHDAVIGQHIADALDKVGNDGVVTLDEGKTMQEDEQVGYNIVLRACRWPLTCIAENAGQDGSLICEKVAEHSGSYGYNAMTDTYEDLLTSGVIDPTKVVRSEIENAASVATLLLTSDAIIAEKPKEEKERVGHGGQYDMY